MSKKLKQPRVIDSLLGRRKALGLYHPDDCTIEIDKRLTGKSRLDTLIHEYLHHISPKAEEEEVNAAATAMADFLWKNRTRIIDSND
jgi:hypothetical protein